MRIDHVEMALVDRHIDRLANRTARMVHGRRHVSQLHESTKILDRCIATLAFKIANKRRAIDRCEHRVRTADFDIARRIARILGELRWRCLHQLAAQALGKMHPLAFDVRAGFLPQFQRFRIIAILDAHLFHQRVGIRLDDIHCFLRQDIGRRYLPRDIGQ